MNRIWLIVFGDLASFFISFLLLIFIRFGKQGYISAINSHTAPFIILCFSWILIFYIFGLYDLLIIKPTIPYLKRWILALLLSFAVGMLLFYFVPIFGISPKINLVIQVTGFGFLSFFFRRITYTFFTRGSIQPAIFIGNSYYLKELEKTIKSSPQMGFKVMGHFPSIRDIDVNQGDIKNSVIILDKEEKIPNENILNFYEQGAEIIDTAKAYEKYLFKIPVEYINISFIVENVNIRKDTFYKSMTFVLDKIFALIVLILSSPILIIAIMARLIEDGKPVFIKQKRVGKNGKIFDLYKLRSMIVLSPDGSAEKDGAIWSTGVNDSRITKVGKVIRKLHIDEISQMVNILKGNMTLVGPRPERPEFVELLNKEIPYYSFRHIVKPGFTGWAQIKYQYARTTEDSKEKFEYDLYYIKNRNIFLNFGIILRTIQIIFTH